MVYKNQKIISYPRWLKKNCPKCYNAWLEIWAFTWIEKDEEHASPIGVCPECGEIADLAEHYNDYGED